MTYNKKDITTIILKNEHDACTADELLLLDQWYNSLDDKSLEHNFNNSNKTLQKNNIWEAVNDKIKEIKTQEAAIVEFKPGKSVFHYIARIAAMLVLIAGAYFAFNWYNNNKMNGAVDTAKYLTRVNNSNSPAKIILPDNSLMWLDAKSTIKYPELFTNHRNITLLAGKVFFNVAHDSANPFTVATEEGLKTTVLGTAFIIEKRAGNSSIKVSVLRGKVKVADNGTNYATLTRNQGVDVNTATKIANLVVVDSLEMTSWFSSKVELDNVTLKEVAASIKQSFGYNVKFSTDKLLSKRCSITYNATDNIEDILILLDKIYHTTHTFSDSTIHIKSTRSIK
ncbi:hypothetical protein BH11BAC5_BH11BAC5_40710 [soil metagenome]